MKDIYINVGCTFPPFWNSLPAILNDNYIPASRSFCFAHSKPLIYPVTDCLVWVVKTYKELGSLLFLQANKSAYHSFMDADRPHKSPSPRRKVLWLTVTAAGRIPAFSCTASQSPSSHRAMGEGWGHTRTWNGLHYRRGNFSLGSPNLLEWA